MIDCPICGLLHEQFSFIGFFPMFTCPRIPRNTYRFILPGYGEFAPEFWAWRE